MASWRASVARQLIAFGRLKRQRRRLALDAADVCRKTTNRLRAIETLNHHLLSVAEATVARQLIAFGRLKRQCDMTLPLAGDGVARQLIAFGRLKPERGVQADHVTASQDN